ncbi:hypothetical protein GW17_00027110 [Ensete ventricosum]|nr:hypothetical protein GW17_00027110 [Ensete ventricosum]
MAMAFAFPRKGEHGVLLYVRGNCTRFSSWEVRKGGEKRRKIGIFAPPSSSSEDKRERWRWKREFGPVSVWAPNAVLCFESWRSKKLAATGLISTDLWQKKKQRSLLLSILESMLDLDSYFTSQTQVGSIHFETKMLVDKISRRMKELVLRKRMELEEICRTAHIEPDTSTASEKIGALIDSDGFCPVQDENKYSAGRGAHLNLKRAEKARAIVTKIPGIS